MRAPRHRQATSSQEASTLVSGPPVHLRRWTSRPRAVVAALHAWARSAEIARRLYGTGAAWIAAGAVHLGARLDSAVLLAGARVLERRRRVALQELGEAVYAGDEASSERLRAHLAAIDSDIARRRETAAALRAGAGEHARRALSAARATEIREPVPESHEPPVPPGSA